MSGGPSPSAFSARTAILLVLVVAFAFSAFVVLLAYAPDLQSGNDRRATAISRSGVGFAGMVQLLRDMGDNPLVLRRAPPLQSADASPGLLILTPQAGQTTAAMQEIAWNGPILIILPKWTVREHPDRAGWVQRTGLAPVGLAQTLLGGYDPSLKLDRREGATNPTLQIGGRRVAVGPIRNLQTLRGPVWTPVVTDERGGAVLSRFARSQIYVLSDPDLMNNQGLRRLEVAEVAQAIIRQLRQGDGPVMFDVTLVGARAERSILRLAFDPPFLGVTLCLVAAAILMGFHAVVRFGAARRPERVFGFGGAALADNTAELIRLAGREATMAPRYAQLVRGLVAKGLAAPKDLAPEPLNAFLDRMSKQRGAEETLTELTEAAGAVRRRDEVVSIAQRLHRWRLEMTREHQ